MPPTRSNQPRRLPIDPSRRKKVLERVRDLQSEYDGNPSGDLVNNLLSPLGARSHNGMSDSDSVISAAPSGISRATSATPYGGEAVFSVASMDQIETPTTRVLSPRDRKWKALMRAIKACPACSSSRTKCPPTHHDFQSLLNTPLTAAEREAVNWLLLHLREAENREERLPEHAVDTAISTIAEQPQDTIDHVNRLFPSLSPTRPANFFYPTNLSDGDLDEGAAPEASETNFELQSFPTDALPQVFVVVSEVQLAPLMFRCYYLDPQLNSCSCLFDSPTSLLEHFRSSHFDVQSFDQPFRVACYVCRAFIENYHGACAGCQHLPSLSQPHSIFMYAKMSRAQAPDMRNSLLIPALPFSSPQYFGAGMLSPYSAQFTGSSQSPGTWDVYGGTSYQFPTTYKLGLSRPRFSFQQGTRGTHESPEMSQDATFPYLRSLKGAASFLFASTMLWISTGLFAGAWYAALMLVNSLTPSTWGIVLLPGAFLAHRGLLLLRPRLLRLC